MPANDTELAGNVDDAGRMLDVVAKSHPQDSARLHVIFPNTWAWYSIVSKFKPEI